MRLGQVIIKKGREKPLRQRHPWVFSGAVAVIDAAIADGEVADVYSADGQFLARGYVNRQSQIVVRILTWEQGEVIDEQFWRSRMETAIRRRSGEGVCCRLINAEADGLPGLVVDRYADWFVLQVLTRGMAQQRDTLIQILADLTKPSGIYERSDADGRIKEGLPRETGLRYGKEPPDEIEVSESGCDGRAVYFLANVKHGHKTGFYLDQRENRSTVARYCEGREVLNAFSYTGGFAAHALVGRALSVVNVDTSVESLRMAEKNIALNGFEVKSEDFVQGDVFAILRQYRTGGREFEVIILDPPKFASSLRQVERAARAYKDLNLVAMQIMPPGGILATFSCSGIVSPDLFQKIVFAASVDAQREVQILRRMSQPEDHPVLLSFPEGEYLKGLLCRVW